MFRYCKQYNFTNLVVAVKAFCGYNIYRYNY